jgi:integrase
VREYLNVIRILHLELGHHNPIADNFQLSSVLQGIKRLKGNKPKYKLPIRTEHLARIRELLNLHDVHDAQIWCALLICFYGLLRISAVCPTRTQPNTDSVLRRRDLHISSKGCTLVLKHSKTNQFHEREHTVVLPYIRESPLCPTSALLNFLAVAGHVSQDEPILTFKKSGHLVPLPQDTVRRRRSDLLSWIGVPVKEYGIHSLRRGGATWLLSSGVPLEVIKSLGDWRSDCVLNYLKPSVSDRFKTLTRVTQTLHTTH